jgi:hypothetical protein
VIAAWEAQAEYAVGVLIARYVAENPAPGQSQVALDLQAWADALVRDGRERLEALGESPLRLADPPQPDRPDRPGPD